MALGGLPGDKEIADAYDEYAKALGLVVHSSNRLAEALSQIFATILAGDMRVTLAVWHSILSDRTQRDMLKAAINGCPEHIWERRLPKARSDLNWLLDRSNELANKRNDAVHAPCIFTSDGTLSEVQAQFNTLNQRAMNLKNKRLIAEFDLYADTAVKLNWFALNARMALAHNAHSWPERPLLPTRDHTHSRA